MYQRLTHQEALNIKALLLSDDMAQVQMGYDILLVRDFEKEDTFTVMTLYSTLNHHMIGANIDKLIIYHPDKPLNYPEASHFIKEKYIEWKQIRERIWKKLMPE